MKGKCYKGLAWDATVAYSLSVDADWTCQGKEKKKNGKRILKKEGIRLNFTIPNFYAPDPWITNNPGPLGIVYGETNTWRMYSHEVE